MLKFAKSSSKMTENSYFHLFWTNRAFLNFFFFYIWTHLNIDFVHKANYSRVNLVRDIKPRAS